MAEKRPDEQSEELRGSVTDPDEEIVVPKTGLPLRVEQMNEVEWKKWTTIAGAVLGLIAAACLFLFPSNDENSIVSIGWLLALVLALVVPGYAEKRLERAAPRLRIALIISLGAAMLVYLAYILLSGKV